MQMTKRSMKALAVTSAVVIGLTGVASTAQAAPYAMAGAPHVTVDNPIVQVQQRKRVPVAKKRKRNNNAALGVAVGLGVLGLAAAAAASQPRRGGVYYTDSWGNPVDAYGQPIYRSAPVQYYRQPQREYYDERYYQPQRPGRWEREQFRAQERAQREAARQQAARQQQWQAERQWRQQQQFQQEQQWRQQQAFRQQQQYRQAPPVFRQDPYAGRIPQPDAQQRFTRQQQLTDPTFDKAQ